MNPIIKKIGSTCWKWLFWAYERGSWQYTLLCAIIILILIFVPFWHREEAEQESSPAVLLVEKELDPQLLYIKIELATDQKPGTTELKQLISTLTEELKKYRQVKNIIPLLSEDGELVGFSLLVQR